MLKGCHTGFSVFFTTSVLWQMVNLEGGRNLKAGAVAEAVGSAASWLALHGSLNLLSPNNLPRDDSTHTLVPYRFAMDQSDGCNSSFGFSIPRSFQFVST